MQTKTGDKKKSQVDQIIERLRQEITEGVLRPKEKIFEEDLAERFSVSRSSIREAFRKKDKKQAEEVRRQQVEKSAIILKKSISLRLKAKN
jgi:DNA-binding FadR family transcriptional regulator